MNLNYTYNDTQMIKLQIKFNFTPGYYVQPRYWLQKNENCIFWGVLAEKTYMSVLRKQEKMSNLLLPGKHKHDLIFGVLTPLSTIFQLYHGDQF
jgi:hypothetical protein